MKKFFWVLAALFLAYAYARIWLDHDPIWREKPYVYRQFVPLTAALLVWLTAMDFRQAVILVVILCALGFAFAIYSLYRIYHHES